MKIPKRRAPDRVVLVLLLSAAVGCAETPIYFPGVTNISQVGPDERVVIGQILYAIDGRPSADGDLEKWLPGWYRASWPRFTYDLDYLQGPQYGKSAPPFGSRGGIFAFKMKRGLPVYLDSVMVQTHSLIKGTALWSLPIMLKLPPTDDPCAFVGTIIVSLPGDHGQDLPWWTLIGHWKSTGQTIKSTVVDTYERDRAALTSYVQGCDLRKALAVIPSAREVEALLAPLRAREAAAEAQRQQGYRESN
jgi:hypothetical protein